MGVSLPDYSPPLSPSLDNVGFALAVSRPCPTPPHLAVWHNIGVLQEEQDQMKIVCCWAPRACFTRIADRRLRTVWHWCHLGAGKSRQVRLPCSTQLLIPAPCRLAGAGMSWQFAMTNCVCGFACSTLAIQMWTLLPAGTGSASMCSSPYLRLVRDRCRESPLHS